MWRLPTNNLTGEYLADPTDIFADAMEGGPPEELRNLFGILSLITLLAMQSIIALVKTSSASVAGQ